MISELRAFGNMDMNEANIHLRNGLKVVKDQAETLLHSMDLIVGRINFEEGEIDKWASLRKAIIDFRTLEVNPGLSQNIMISEENMERLHELYGVRTNLAINRVINDLIEEEDKRYKDKTSIAKLQRALDKIEQKQNHN